MSFIPFHFFFLIVLFVSLFLFCILFVFCQNNGKMAGTQSSLDKHLIGKKGGDKTSPLLFQTLDSDHQSFSYVLIFAIYHYFLKY